VTALATYPDSDLFFSHRHAPIVYTDSVKSQSYITEVSAQVLDSIRKALAAATDLQVVGSLSLVADLLSSILTCLNRVNIG
jgi:hypothetical protein